MIKNFTKLVLPCRIRFVYFLEGNPDIYLVYHKSQLMIALLENYIVQKICLFREASNDLFQKCSLKGKYYDYWMIQYDPFCKTLVDLSLFTKEKEVITPIWCNFSIEHDLNKYEIQPSFLEPTRPFVCTGNEIPNLITKRIFPPKFISELQNAKYAKKYLYPPRYLYTPQIKPILSERKMQKQRAMEKIRKSLGIEGHKEEKTGTNKRKRVDVTQYFSKKIDFIFEKNNEIPKESKNNDIPKESKNNEIPKESQNNDPSALDNTYTVHEESLSNHIPCTQIQEEEINKEDAKDEEDTRKIVKIINHSHDPPLTVVLKSLEIMPLCTYPIENWYTNRVTECLTDAMRPKELDPELYIIDYVYAINNARYYQCCFKGFDVTIIQNGEKKRIQQASKICAILLTENILYVDSPAPVFSYKNIKYKDQIENAVKQFEKETNHTLSIRTKKSTVSELIAQKKPVFYCNDIKTYERTKCLKSLRTGYIK